MEYLESHWRMECCRGKQFRMKIFRNRNDSSNVCSTHFAWLRFSARQRVIDTEPCCRWDVYRIQSYRQYAPLQKSKCAQSFWNHLQVIELIAFKCLSTFMCGIEAKQSAKNKHHSSAISMHLSIFAIFQSGFCRNFCWSRVAHLYVSLSSNACLL